MAKNVNRDWTNGRDSGLGPEGPRFESGHSDQSRTFSRTETDDFPAPVAPSGAKTGRPAMGPRLYLRKDTDGINRWIIRDTGRDLRTGCSENEYVGAQAALEAYNQGRQMPSRTDSLLGYVYFVTCMTSLHYPIKIGWAKNVATRVQGMQGANPNVLTVLVTTPGTIRDERKLHARFRHLHIRGEWFRAHDELRDYMASLPGYIDAYGVDEFIPDNRTIAAE